MRDSPGSEALDALDQCRWSRNASYGLRWQHHNETVAANATTRERSNGTYTLAPGPCCGRLPETTRPDPDLGDLALGPKLRQGSRDVGLLLVWRTITNAEGARALYLSVVSASFRT